MRDPNAGSTAYPQSQLTYEQAAPFGGYAKAETKRLTAARAAAPAPE
jgi:hypothetical protein